MGEKPGTLIQERKLELTVLKATTAKGLKQRLLVLLYNHLVGSVLNYGPKIPTLSRSKCERLELIRNEGMHQSWDVREILQL